MEFFRDHLGQELFRRLPHGLRQRQEQQRQDEDDPDGGRDGAGRSRLTRC
jgi:hypothetical protein